MTKPLQHTVSRFYLKQFTPLGGDKVLQQYNRRTLRVCRVAPSVATVHAHFYSAQSPNGKWDDSLEDWLAKIESEAAPPLKALAERMQPDARNRFIIAYFIGAMFLRITRMRENADLHAQEFATPEGAIRFIERKRSDLLKRFTEEDVARYKKEVRDRQRGIEVSPTYYFHDAPRRAERYARSIFEMGWTVETASRGSFFVTSDNPAFVRRPKSIRDPGLVGLDRDDLGAELGFPLSRAAFLLCRWRGEQFATRNATATRVDHLNERSVLSAHEFVFAPERSDYIAKLVAKNSDFRLCHPTLNL